MLFNQMKAKYRDLKFRYNVQAVNESVGNVHSFCYFAILREGQLIEALAAFLFRLGTETKYEI